MGPASWILLGCSSPPPEPVDTSATEVVTTPTPSPEAPPSPTTPPLPAPSATRFVVIGDAGKGNQGQLDVAAAIARKCKVSGCDFVVMLGDNLYESGATSPKDPIFQDKFEEPYSGVDLPFWIVLGNHDYGGSGLGNEFGKGAHQIAYTELSDKWELPAAYYRKTAGVAEFFAFDTNMAMYAMAEDQKKDVPAWVSASTATWKIALGHHPYRSNGPHGNAGNYDGGVFPAPADGTDVRALVDTVCGAVDVYLSGHDHSMQWLTTTCSGTELIVVGTGATTTELEGSNPAFFQAATLGFLYVTLDEKAFTGTFIDIADAELFTRSILR